MPQLIVFRAGDAGPAEQEQLPLLAALAPGEALELEPAALNAVRPGEPSVAVLMPSAGDAVPLARRLRRGWASAHLVLVRPASGLDEIRQALGPAPMLGRQWSLAPLEGTALADAVRQALDGARQRRQFRATLQSTNARIAASHAVPRAEYQRLVASEHHLANFLRHAGDAVIGVDSALRVLFWSHGAEQLLGLPAAQALGRALPELDGWGGHLSEVADRVRAEGAARTHEFLDDRGGRRRALEVVASPVVQEEGGPPGLSMVIRDITERRLAQERLEQANQSLEQLVAARTSELERSQLALFQAQKLEAVGKLTGGVAHDFNNVLQVIGSNLQLLQAQLPADGGGQPLLRAALAGVERGAKLAAQLLAFARRQPLNPLPLNISRRVRDMDDLLRRALGEQIELEISLAAGLWTTLVDPVQLENVVLNLAINARDAMPEGGRLTIETANCTLDENYTAGVGDIAPGQYVMLAVSDTGTGMPAEVMAHAFEPFFTTKPEGQGTGLGLSMAYGFAKQSGGHIRLYSELGAGTTIKLYLPRSHDKEVQPLARADTPVTGGSETVLVVEDDLAVQTAVVNMLQALGYRVLKAGNAQAALSILESGVHVDLLFTDVVMPGPLRSPELARRAKALLPGIPVLFTSGYTQNAIVHGGRLDPDVELLSKPYRQEDLARKLRQLLGRRQPAPAPAPEASPAEVLLVEDEPDLRETTLQLLELLGCRVRAVASAEEALRELERGRYRLLLTDVSLPGRNGVALAVDAARLDPAMKIVFATGYGARIEVPAGIEHTTLTKPYTMEDLERVLR